MPSLAGPSCGHHPVTINCSAATNLYHHSITLCPYAPIFFIVGVITPFMLSPYRVFEATPPPLVAEFSICHSFSLLRLSLLAHRSCRPTCKLSDVSIQKPSARGNGVSHAATASVVVWWCIERQHIHTLVPLVDHL